MTARHDLSWWLAVARAVAGCIVAALIVIAVPLLVAVLSGSSASAMEPLDRTLR